MRSTNLARLLDSTWTYLVLLFGSIVAVVYASGTAAGTSYPSESWMRYGWPVGFGLMAGAAFVAAFKWDWVRLFEVVLLSLLFAGAYRYANAWPHMHPMLVWLVLASATAIFMIGALNDQMKKLGPDDRIIWPVITAIVLGAVAGAYFHRWQLLIAVVVGGVVLLAVAGFMPTRREYYYATR